MRALGRRGSIWANVGSRSFLLRFYVRFLYLRSLRARATEATVTKRKFRIITSRVILYTHDPSIVLAYEDEEGNTYPSADAKAGLKKVYFVFGTQIANAKSYDLVNWTFFENNLGDSEKLYAELRTPAAYSSLDVDTILGNSWAPDVIYNRAKGKWTMYLSVWTMYLSVNGSYMNTSSIVLLEAESLNGNWSYAGTVVWSGFHYSDKARYTDFGKVCGSDEVPERYGVSETKANSLIWSTR